MITFGADMSSLVHIDNKKKDILILGKDPTDDLDDIMLKTEKEAAEDILLSNRKTLLEFVL